MRGHWLSLCEPKLQAWSEPGSGDPSDLRILFCQVWIMIAPFREGKLRALYKRLAPCPAHGKLSTALTAGVAVSTSVQVGQAITVDHKGHP